MNKITFYSAGGLGNLLFMLANAYNLSLKYGLELEIYKINRYFNNNDTKRKLIDEYDIFKNFNVLQDNNLFKTYHNYHENGFIFQTLTLENNQNYNLHGYFQSWKYFENNFHNFKKLLVNNYETYINDYLNVIKKKYNDNTIVSVHFRRTDYLKHPNFHLNLDMNYYVKALDNFDKENNVFMFFSDDIEWVKTQNFDFLKNKIYVDEPNEEYNLWLMSKCDHNIIANSSFSLWASYLNENSNKKVVAPSRWFGPIGPSHNIYDILFDSYIIINI
jgi:hypothetical protein